MIDIKSLDELARKLSESLPPGLKTLGEETEARFKAILQSAMQKMELVTREEFEVQTEVLARTRQKLKQLEAQIEQLESS